MKKRILSLFLVTVLLLGGCTGEPTPTQPAGETTIGPAVTSSAVPTEPQNLNPEWKGCEVISPEEGVLILHGNESLQDAIIEGDVYITANADVTFDHVSVQGNLYIHGKLTYFGRNRANGIYTYKDKVCMCSAYDTIHGEIRTEYMVNATFSYGEKYIAVDALDYAFETWGKVEFTRLPPTEVRSEVGEDDKQEVTKPTDPSPVTILRGKQILSTEIFKGDVYIPSDADITFCDVTVNGNLYVAGKLHILDYGATIDRNFMVDISGNIYTYDFGVTCEAFDGTHGQVTGGPVRCGGYVVANDALDYAFETWGKQ